MSKYKISNSDLTYAEEFKNQTFGYHSPGLQRVLNVLRGGPLEGKLVLIVIEPYKRWALGQLTSKQGDPVKLMEDQEFTNLEQAEWAVFKMRWKLHTGKELKL